MRICLENTEWDSSSFKRLRRVLLVCLDDLFTFDWRESFSAYLLSLLRAFSIPALTFSRMFSRSNSASAAKKHSLCYAGLIYLMVSRNVQYSFRMFRGNSQQYTRWSFRFASPLFPVAECSHAYPHKRRELVLR